MSVTLYLAGGAGSEPFQNSVTDLQATANFEEAVVNAGTWIFYKFKDFNDRTDNQESWIKILTPSQQKVDITNFNGSVYLLEQQTEGIVLFEHYYYGGKRKVPL